MASAPTPTPIHTIYQKNVDGTYRCPHCGISKNRQNTMYYHIKTHEGHLPFQCSHCDKEFLQAATLAIHIAARHAAVTAAAFACPCCPFKSLTKSNRAIHYLRKHCADEVTAFQARQTHSLTCGACQKVCNSSTAYLYHVAAKCLPLSHEKRVVLDGLFT